MRLCSDRDCTSTSLIFATYISHVDKSRASWDAFPISCSRPGRLSTFYRAVLSLAFGLNVSIFGDKFPSASTFITMSLGKSSSPSHRGQPDLFFPASDSEEEDLVPVQPVGSNIDVKPSSPEKFSVNGFSNTTKKSGNRQSDRVLPGSQGSDIVALEVDPQSFAGPSIQPRLPLDQSPSSNVPPSFMGGYLGEFVCEGWSLSKGKGYCVPGSKVVFERPKAAKGKHDESRVLARSRDKVGPAKLVNGRVVNAKVKPAGGKQITLGALGVGKKAATAVSLPSTGGTG